MKNRNRLLYNTKTILCLLFSLVLFFSIFGCSNDKQSDNKSSNTQSNNSASSDKVNYPANNLMNNPTVLVSSISNGYGFTLRVGDKKQMSVNITPDNASNKNVEWSTSDESVVSINSKTGLLTAKAAGVVKVTAKALDGGGIKDSCTVTVVFGTSKWNLTPNHKITNFSLPYYLYFEKDAYTISVYGQGKDGYYSKLVKTISSSRGRTINMTPAGTFKLNKEKRWYQFKIGLYWTQYCIRYSSDMYLHGPLYKRKSGDTMYINEYNQIGTASTAGCLAMATANIKWIWDNCPDGTTLEIVSGAPIGNVEQVPPRIPEDGPAIDPSDPEMN